MIRTVVFDIGGVLADFRLKEFLAEKGFDGPMIRRILNASVMSPFWGQFERAEITEQEALDAFAGLDPEIRAELNTAFADIHGMLTIRPFAANWVRRLKQAGYRVYYCSNYSRKAYDECSDSLTFLQDMDGGVLSFQIGRTKPDPEMYRAFLEKCRLTAGECVFLDDTPGNVTAAENLGFHAVLFTSYEDAVRRLEELGVKC